MSLFKFVFLFGVLSVSLSNVRAVSEEDRQKIHTAMIPHVTECTADFKVNEDDIKKAKEAGTVGALDPCLMACLFKKTKLMDDQGLFDADKAEELSIKFLSNEADQDKALVVITTCKEVNDRDVTDGEKGCERAGLLFECFIPFKESFIN